MKSVDVAIAGGGPFGLMLAIELGRRDISVTLVDPKPGTAFNPQANATQARTMEYFRRLGFADEVRGAGLPADYPTDIAYYTRFNAHQLARFPLPSSDASRKMVEKNAGPWSAAEAPHRVTQKHVEPILRKYAEAIDCVSVEFNRKVTAFANEGSHVDVAIENVDGSNAEMVRARYFVGADGARSFVRKALGFSLEGEHGKKRSFLGGRMYAVYLKCPDFYKKTGVKPAWMNWTFNVQRRCVLAAVDGREEFAFHTQLSDDVDETSLTHEDAANLFYEACGERIDCEVLSHMGWTAGNTLVANKFRLGSVFIGGDAAHLFTPTGGLGYNTAVEDAVNLGWKLASVIKGTAGPGLLDSYEIERKASALRNTGYARGFADSIGNFVADPRLEQYGDLAAELRKEAGDYLNAHARKEFNIPGITFGTRYDGSPVIAESDEEPPEDVANNYVPTGVPGGRPPHWWLDSDTSLYDKFGFDWTLLAFDGADTDAISSEAVKRGLTLDVLPLDVPEIRALYGADLALVRPDQMLAWRGTPAESAAAVWDRALGV